MKPSWDCWTCRVDLQYPPPTLFDLSDMWVELYILNAEEQFLSTQCRRHSFFTPPCDTLVLTASSPSLSATSSAFLILPWERVFRSCWSKPVKKYHQVAKFHVTLLRQNTFFLKKSQANLLFLLSVEVCLNLGPRHWQSLIGPKPMSRPWFFWLGWKN